MKTGGDPVTHPNSPIKTPAEIQVSHIFWIYVSIAGSCGLDSREPNRDKRQRLIIA